VVVPTFKRVSVLCKALDSLRTQTRLPEEVVVVTKSCDPDSAHAFRRYLEGDRLGIAWRHVIVDERSILAAERAAVSASRGDVICFLDDDVVAKPDWLSRIAYYYQDQKVGGVGGRDIVHQDDCIDSKTVKRAGRVSWFGRMTGNHHNEIRRLCEVDFLKGCNMSYRRSIALKLDEHLIGEITYGFEIDLGLTARRLGYSVVYDPEIIVDHFPSRHTPMERTDPKNVYIVSHNQTYAVLKHFGLARRVVFLLYSHMLGDRNTPGLARCLWLPLPEGRNKLDVLRASYRGKRDGWKLFRILLRNREIRTTTAGNNVGIHL
jgi:GT2 family glycosyltransferase